MKHLKIYFKVLISFGLFALTINNIRANCQNPPPMEVRDTIDNYVIYHHNKGIRVYKIGVFLNKEQITATFDYSEISNKSAMVECGINFTPQKMEALIKDSVVPFLEKKAAGKYFVSLILSKSLNIEYFELLRCDLSSADAYIIYKAFYASDFFSIWNEPVPYVIFGIPFFIK